MRLIATADWHIRRDKQDETLRSLAAIRNGAEKEQVDAVLVSGDIFDSAAQATGAWGYPRFLAAIQRIGDVAPVVVIRGTPSHDVEGMVDVLEQLECRFGVYVLRPGVAYYLEPDRVAEEYSAGLSQAMLFGVPEPSKSWLLSNKEGLSAGEATEAMQDALRQLLLGYGALRAEHPDIPAVLLYHGQVRGATMQNGQRIEGGLGAEDLRLADADYYALGDIHEPQLIGKAELPMKYPGSIVPQNWGETHRAQVSLVDFSGDNRPFAVSVSPKYMPQPQLAKRTTSVVERPADSGLQWLDALEPDANISGLRVWLEITCTRAQASEIDPDEVLAAMFEEGALQGSRVTLSIQAEETVRAGEIQEQQRLRDKLNVWAENTDLELSGTVRDRADELEDEVKQETGAVASGRIRLQKVSIRGAVGFWKNQREDEVELDLEDFDAGVLALIGPNGMGKTTLIENMHPWPQMLTREGKLQDHFRLRDSWRKLWWTDEETGWRYRAELLIDGQNKSGGVEYYLYWSADNEAWEPLTGINGRKEPYLEWITQLWGSLELYLRTTFITQRPTRNAPELENATKSERKQLFSELAGLDYFDAYRDRAKEKRGNLETVINHQQGKLETLKQRLEERAGKHERYQAVQAEVQQLESRLEKLEADGAQARKARDDAKAYADKQTDLRRRVEEKQRQQTEVLREIQRLETQIDESRAALEGREEAEAELAKHGTLSARLEELRTEYNQALEAHQQRMSDYQAVYEEAAKVDRERERIEARVKHIKEHLAGEHHDQCPECGATLPWAKGEAEKREDMQAELEAREAELEKLPHYPYPEKPAELDYDTHEIESLKRQISFLDVDGAQKTVDAAKAAQQRIKTAEQTIAERSPKVGELERDLAGLQEQLDDSAQSSLAKAEEAYEHAREQYSTANADLAGKRQEEKSLNTDLVELDKAEEEANRITAEVKEKHAEVGNWKLLERACGRDGIPALELDAVAPSIAGVANRLLSAAYGQRYQLRFETTKLSSGGGARSKQLEDFLIYVVDSETGGEQEISTLSGGESVWVKRAIYDAFSAIRARNTGMQFRTAFQDEADGALDPDARVRYLRMLEQAHKESGRHQTLLITHSPELQAMIEQTIDVREIIAREAVSA